MENKVSQFKLLAAAACLLLLPYFLLLAISPHFPSGGDETFQTQAAIELFLGKGYLSSLYTMPLDISFGKYTYLNSWPPGYSLMILLLMKSGFSPSSAEAAWQAVTVFFAFSFWLLCARRFLVKLNWQLLFLGALTIHFFSWGNFNTSTFTWGFMGLITWILSKEKKDDTLPLSEAFQLSLLSALLILFRFQNITFLPALFFFYFITLAKTFGTWKKLILPVFTLVSLPALTFAVILYTNLIWSGNAFFATGGESGLFLQTLWKIPKMFSLFLMGGSLRLDSVIHYLDQSANTQNMMDLSGVAAVIALAYPVFKNKSNPIARRGILWFSVSFFFLGAMFVYVGLRHNYLPYLDHTRYFHYLFPVLLVAVFSYLEQTVRLNQRFISVVAFCFCLAALGTSVAFSVHRNQLASAFQSKFNTAHSRIVQLRAEFPNYRFAIIADSQFPGFVQNKVENIHLKTDHLMQGGVFFSSPTVLVLVHDSNPVKELYTPLASLDKLQQRFGLAKESLDQEIEIYWKAIPAGFKPPPN